MSSRNPLAGAVLALMFHVAAASADAQQILGISPELPTSADEIRISVARPAGSCTFALAIQGNTITLNLKSSPDCKAPPPPDPFLVVEAFVPPLAAGSYTLVVMSDGQLTASRPILVQAPSSQLSLLQGRFMVSVAWTASHAQSAAAASAVQLGDGSGYFWFFSAEGVDLTVKMINAVALDSHYWFFASSGTNQQFTITVTDTWLGRTHTYQNSAGLNKNILDFSSFMYLP